MILATTILGIRHKGRVALAGDGQVTVGDTIMKHTARKIRPLHGGTVLAGFAGSAADALTLFDKFEGHLDKHSGNLRRAAVEMAREWRRDRFLRRLEAWMIVANVEDLLVISGEGDIIEPDENVAAIGSGAGYAQAAATALAKHTELSAPEIARIAMEIAASICIYTNNNIMVLELPGEEGGEKQA